MMTINTSNNPTEVIELIKHCKDIIKTQYNRVIKYIYKRGKILKWSKRLRTFSMVRNKVDSQFTLKLQFIKYLKIQHCQQVILGMT